MLYARLVLPATGMLVAAMAATTLLNGERMCERVLESPGVEEPLSNLHSAMGFVLCVDHACPCLCELADAWCWTRDEGGRDVWRKCLASLPPHACSGLPAPPGVSTFLMAQEPSPMQQCKAVSAWLELAVGGALPYCILRWLEHKGRAAFAAQQRHGGQQRGQGPSSGTDADGSSPLWRDFLAHYLLCCTVWCILCIVF